MISDKHFSTEMELNHGYRFPHTCSEKRDRPLVVTRTLEGWKWFCHRCDEKGMKFLQGLAPSEWLKFNQAPGEHEQAYVDKIELPPDTTSEIPPAGLAWLYKAGLEDIDIKRFNFGFSPTLQRVILPVYKRVAQGNNKLVYYQARYLQKPSEKHPKYINVRAKSRENIYFHADHLQEETVVLVEDILSAIRVGNHLPTLGLLYAYVPDDLIYSLSRAYSQIILWLDPDKHGRMMDRVRTYRSMGLNVVMIRSGEDPKFYTDDEIAEKLETAMA